jgi:transposase InsO family protein
MKDYNTYFSVDQMARVLGVSRSGYYDFLKRPPSSRSFKNEELLDKIRIISKASHETYGSPRIHAELIEQGYSCSRPTIARLMKAHAIQAKMYKKFKKTTKQSKRPYYRGQDLVQQNFSASIPNTVWVADISQIPIYNKWVYLAVILDLFSRKVVGMALQETMKAELVVEALTAALLLRNPPQGLIHHSDLGGQFTSYILYKKAQEYGINLSHGKTGCSYDNAAMESFFHTLKTELTHFKNYQTLEEAKLDIFAYIYTFYNSKRRHSTLNYQSPNQWELNYQQSQTISVHSV